MPDVKGSIEQQEGVNPTVPSTGTQTTTTVTSASTTGTATVSTVGIQGTSGTAVNLEQGQNVDTTTDGLENGSILVYKTATSQWPVSYTHLTLPTNREV